MKGATSIPIPIRGEERNLKNDGAEDGHLETVLVALDPIDGLDGIGTLLTDQVQTALSHILAASHSPLDIFSFALSRLQTITHVLKRRLARGGLLLEFPIKHVSATRRRNKGQ